MGPGACLASEKAVHLAPIGKAALRRYMLAEGPSASCGPT